MGYHSEEDWPTFVSHVKKLINSKEKRDLYGRNAEKFAKKLFRIQTAVDKLEELMESLVDKK